MTGSTSKVSTKYFNKILQQTPQQIESLPMQESTLEKLKNLIANGRLDAAINLLNQASNSPKEDIKISSEQSKEILHLSSRYNSLSAKQRKGIIDEAAFNLENNKISNSLIHLIDELENGEHIDHKDLLSNKNALDNTKNISTPNANNKFKNYALIGGGFLLLLLTFFYISESQKDKLTSNSIEIIKKSNSDTTSVDTIKEPKDTFNKTIPPSNTVQQSKAVIPEKVAKKKPDPTPAQMNYSNYLSEGLLMLDMQNYDLAKLKFEKAIKESPKSTEAKNALDWIQFIQNSDKLYAEDLSLEQKQEVDKIYARCILPPVLERIKTPEGKVETKVIKEASLTPWREVICGDAYYLKKLNKAIIIKIQKKLKREGFYFGSLNGEMSKFLIASIKVYYRDMSCLSSDPMDCAFFPKDYIPSTFFEAIGIKPN